ncbi:hypothetical protein Tco_0026529 [Tanacetum coccineum]
MLGNTRKDAGFWCVVLAYMESKTKLYGRRTYDMVNEKWKMVRPAVVRFCEVYGNVMRRMRESGASDVDYYARALMDYEAEPNYRETSINLNTNVGDDDEDEVQKIRRPIGRDKARNAAKKKGSRESRASGSSSMNDEAFARLMVTEMTSQEKEQREAFLEIKRREVECRKREDARFAMEELRAEIKAKKKSILINKPDRWFWSLEGSGEFSVASIRRFIDDQRLLTVDSKTLWIKSVPIKVNILAWKIKLEALPTRFNISRRVRQIARKICSWWDIEYSDVNSFTEWINWMASLRLQSKVKMMIQGVFFVVWWLVWSYRNKLLFEEKKPSKAIIFDDVVSISFYWCKSRCKASFSWDDWLKNPSLISL